MEHQDELDRLEREADRMEEESERVEGQIAAARQDWEAKESDQSVPGAQSEESGEVASTEAPESPTGEDPEETVE
jgi:predicted nuclease with TOPRIM domain